MAARRCYNACIQGAAWEMIATGTDNHALNIGVRMSW